MVGCVCPLPLWAMLNSPLCPVKPLDPVSDIRTTYAAGALMVVGIVHEYDPVSGTAVAMVYDEAEQLAVVDPAGIIGQLTKAPTVMFTFDTVLVGTQVMVCVLPKDH